MPDIRVVKYEDSDKEKVVDLILTIQQKEFGVLINLQDQPDLLNIPSFYQKGNGNFWIASVDNDIAGTISLFDIGNQMVALRKMFVKAEYRGNKSGIGQILLNTVFDWCQTKNISTIFLGTTEKFIAAQRFYEKNGFIEIPKDTLPDSFPVMHVDVKFYKKQMIDL